MYLKITQNQTLYPYHVDQLRNDHPHVSFPSDYRTNHALLSAFGIHMVADTPWPEVDRFSHRLQEAEPVEVNGQYVQQWQVIELTEQEQQEKIHAAQRELEALVQEQLNAFAMQKGYNGIESAVSYVYSGVARFAEEAKRAISVRDTSWSRLYEIFEQVNQGQRAMPQSLAEIESELPALTWDTTE
jgi:hypothetical protein